MLAAAGMRGEDAKPAKTPDGIKGLFDGAGRTGGFNAVINPGPAGDPANTCRISVV